MKKNESKITSTPAFLCIGFFCHDRYKDDLILGGTTSYASLIAQKMIDQPVAVLTSVGDDFLFMNTFEEAGIEVCNKRAEKTTVFSNIYKEGQRTQYIHARAETLSRADVPVTWRSTPIVKLCLIADEVDHGLMQAFPDSLIAATIQGWLRQWDAHGKIKPKEMDLALLEQVDIVLMGDADIKGLDHLLAQIIERVSIVVMTKGDQGAIVFYQGAKYFFPSFPIKEVDPTGAGDVFAVSFLLKYAASKSIYLAASYAHVVASFVVEGIGVHISTLEAINKRWETYQKNFPQTSILKNRP